MAKAEVHLVLAVILVTCASLTQSAIRIEKADHSWFPGMCWDPSIGVLLEGVAMTRPVCEELRCKKTDTGMVFQYSSCPVTAPPPPQCRLVPDPTKNYPDCCPIIVC